MTEAVNEVRVICPSCRQTTFGGIEETFWKESEVWQLRQCRRCGRLLITTTEVVGKGIGETRSLPIGVIFSVFNRLHLDTEAICPRECNT